MDGSEVTLLIAILAFATPINIAIVEGLKQAGSVSPRWAMPASIVIGILITGLVAATDLVNRFDLKPDIGLVVLAGLLCGLGASGLYSGVRSIAGAGSNG